MSLRGQLLLRHHLNNRFWRRRTRVEELRHSNNSWTYRQHHSWVLSDELKKNFDTAVGQLKMLVAAVYMVFGMALLSMAFNLLQVTVLFICHTRSLTSISESFIQSCKQSCSSYRQDVEVLSRTR